MRLPPKLELLKMTMKARQQELRHIELAQAAKKGAKKNDLIEFVKIRLDNSRNMLEDLDPARLEPEAFAMEYAKRKAVKDEYQLLLDVLADPDKRADKCQQQISELSVEIERLEKLGGSSGQY
jgi:hypothetical protein